MTTDRTTKVLLALIAIALFLNVIVPFAQPPTVQAQETTEEQFAGELLEVDAWRMHSSATTARTWLHNAKTGKVYRVQFQCEGTTSGCLIALPVFSADRLGEFLPNPG